MRADRLLSIMLLLQSKGQMTAADLADKLAVSERTIYRDVDALSLAGIPVYAQGGRGGGIALEENYRISLTGLNKAEIQSLFVSGSSAPLSDLGLEQANENTLLKLLAALPSLHRMEAERVRQRIYIDPIGWFAEANPSPLLPLIQTAVLSDSIVYICYERNNGTQLEREVQAYGLVAKAAVWYLVGAHDGKWRTYRLSRILDCQLRDTSFIRDEDFQLVDYWREAWQGFVGSFSKFFITIKIREHMRKDIVNHPLFSAVSMGESVDGWFRAESYFDSREQALIVLMSLARDIQIIDPPDLHDELLSALRVALDNLTINRP